MEGGLRLSKALQVKVLKAAERMEATCENYRIRIIKPQIPDDLNNPFIIDLMKRGFKIDRLGDHVRIGIFGAAKAVIVSEDIESSEQEFPVSISELVSLWPDR